MVPGRGAATGTGGGGDGGEVVVAAERPGLRLMRIVGSQYDATVGVEAWVAKAEAKVEVRKTRNRGICARHRSVSEDDLGPGGSVRWAETGVVCCAFVRSLGCPCSATGGPVVQRRCRTPIIRSFCADRPFAVVLPLPPPPSSSASTRDELSNVKQRGHATAEPAPRLP